MGRMVFIVQLHSNKFEIQDRMDKSVGKYNLTKLNPIEVESLNRVISTEKQ